MSDLPLGICRDILLRLPAEALFRFRAVCKRWHAIIDDPGFVKAHTNNQLSSYSTTIIIRISTGPPFYPLYYFNLEALNFSNGLQTIPAIPLKLTRSGLSSLPALPVASCNGLMLTAPQYRRRSDDETNWLEPQGAWEIRNPLTHERLKLPQTNIIYSKVVCYGLGYDCIADDYKVVVIDCPYNVAYNISIWQTHVYSLKSDSWKEIGNCPFGLSNQKNMQQCGVFLNGALHWVSSSDGVIIGLDVGTENYRLLAVPGFERRLESTMQLDAMSGCLFLSYYFDKHFTKPFDVWVMNDYGREDSWVKLLSLDNSVGLRPIAYMRNKRQVLLQDYYGFVWFDVESKSVKTFTIHGVSENYSAQVCVGSLFRLHHSCGGSAGRVAAASKTRMKANTYYTKLTFCVRDEKDRSPHDDCYILYSNWYNSSCEGDKLVHMAPCNPDSDFDTLFVSVPLDICCEILLRLPAKSLIRFRAVCNAWRAVIDDPPFVNAHTNKQLSSNTIVIRNSTGPPFYPHYSFDLDSLNFSDGLQKIVATPLNFTHSGLTRLRPQPMSACDGLILIAGKSWEIWNPLTHECLKLLGKCDSNTAREAIGLGYDHTSDDYKAVVIHRHPLGREGHVFPTHVYSLRTDSWRNIGNCPCNDDPWDPIGHGVFFCGALHWILPAEWGVDSTILSLDLGTESYRQLQLPTLLKRQGELQRRRRLYVLDRCLVLSNFGTAIEGKSKAFDVWVRKDYGADDSWIKLFSIKKKDFHTIHNLRLVAYMKDKMQVLLQDDFLGFFLFDFERNSMKHVGIHGLSGNSMKHVGIHGLSGNSMKHVGIHGLSGILCAEFIPGSIFRLHDNCGVSGRKRRIMTRESKMKVSDTELYFCVRDANSHGYGPHDNCYSLDSNWEYSSNEED